MNLSDLANLVIVRNHLQVIINNNAIVRKDRYREMDSIVRKLDNAFIDGVASLDTENLAQERGCVSKKEKAKKTLPVKTEKAVVLPEAEEPPAPKEPAPKKAPAKEDKQMSLPIEQEEATGREKTKKEISDRLAEAKKEVASRKKKGLVTRSDD